MQQAQPDVRDGGWPGAASRGGAFRRLVGLLMAAGFVGAGGIGLLAAGLLASEPAYAQGGGWQTGVNPQPQPKGKSDAPAANASDVTLTARLTEDGQPIDQGLVWRVFEAAATPDGRSRPIGNSRDATLKLRLAPGEYIVIVAFGRAHLTRRLTVRAGLAVNDSFVLNAGGLRLAARLANGTPAPDNAVTYDIFSDERDRHGNRVRIMTGARPGLIVRLNAGLYQVVSTYGDANAIVRADVTVEAGKLTDVQVTHGAARVTFRLTTRSGGVAMADTEWSVTTREGRLVKTSVGALPSHVLAAGTYIVTARHGGHTYKGEFTVSQGDVTEVEVLME